jgi:3-phosphoshikimate 1-carboxyvinyltransferase
LVRTYDDHRMAMAFTIAGLRVPGVVIDDPGCVTKTWPGFFAEVARWTD